MKSQKVRVSKVAVRRVAVTKSQFSQFFAVNRRDTQLKPCGVEIACHCSTKYMTFYTTESSEKGKNVSKNKSSPKARPKNKIQKLTKITKNVATPLQHK